MTPCRLVLKLASPFARRQVVRDRLRVLGRCGDGHESLVPCVKPAAEGFKVAHERTPVFARFGSGLEEGAEREIAAIEQNAGRDIGSFGCRPTTRERFSRNTGWSRGGARLGRVGEPEEADRARAGMGADDRAE